MSNRSIPLTAYQFRLLAVLALINFVNFAARQVIVPLIPLLRDSLHVTDAQLGSLQTYLLVVLALASIPFGFFADRFSRKLVIAFGIFFWSAATFAGGLASAYFYFVVARAFVGLGEAAYAPAAQSMISGAFPHERRAFAQAIFAARTTGGRRRSSSLRVSACFQALRCSGLKIRRAVRDPKSCPLANSSAYPRLWR